VDPVDILVVALLAVLGTVLGLALGMCYLVRRHLRLNRDAEVSAGTQARLSRELSRFTVAPLHPLAGRRPSRWLAIRTRDTHAVQLALGLENPQPCSWSEGLFEAREYFIAPPVNGWTLVFGSGLPVPDDDVDVFYRQVRQWSSQLGQVQYFQADQVLQHHAWVQVESGRVLRAYAWAGTVLWNQGVKTADEIQLGLNCFGYGENPGTDDWAVAEHVVENVERVARLARRWSLDPARIDARALAHQPGVAGRGGNRR
jgi:hypothetical protein